MCSVSFLPHSRGYYLGMNRDESLRRATARPPRVVPAGDRTALYPSEASGGSWLGMNDAGLCVALINWYGVAGGTRRSLVSRGILVPALVSAGAFGEVRQGLMRMGLDDILPFRLLVFAPSERVVREFRWDRQTLEEQSHAWAPRHWFSSGYDEPRARHERGQTARSAWREARAGSLPWLRRLHGSHEPARGPFCFCMHRRDAATVSYTEVVVTTRTAAMRYHDGPLCCTPLPATSHRLPLQPGRKEPAPIPTNQETEYAHESLRPPLQSTRRTLLPGGLSTRREVFTITRRGRHTDTAHL